MEKMTNSNLIDYSIIIYAIPWIITIKYRYQIYFGNAVGKITGTSSCSLE